MHILIVEDDKELCDAVKLQLNARKHTVDCCHTGSEALYCAMKGAYDLILLDRMLPEIDGLSILRSIRQNHITVPVIVTTALDTINDRIDGLDCGADDRILSCRGEERQLSKREALLLEFFMRNPEKTLAREQIFFRVWGPDGIVEDGNLDTYIYFLRKHLRTLGSRTVISTVHGLGYRMEGSA